MSYVKNVDVEKEDLYLYKTKLIRTLLFALSCTLFTVMIIILALMYFDNDTSSFYNFWLFSIILLFLAGSIGSIITNMDRLNQIKKIINDKEKQWAEANLPLVVPMDVNYTYGKDLWIFPLVSFILICMVIIILIILNTKCNYNRSGYEKL